MPTVATFWPSPAVDSIPAILAITQDTFIVYTSNIMAILGLRALYFALSAMVHRFHYLKYALAAVLVFIGSKILIADFVLGGAKFPPLASLGVTIGLIAGGVLLATADGACVADVFELQLALRAASLSRCGQ